MADGRRCVDARPPSPPFWYPPPPLPVAPTNAFGVLLSWSTSLFAEGKILEQEVAGYGRRGPLSPQIVRLYTLHTWL